MMLTLKRDTIGPDCTLGILSVGEDKKLHTIEQPWVPHPSGGPAGAHYVSRVPAGMYRLERFKMPSGEQTLVLSNPQSGVFPLPFNIPKLQREQLRSRITIRAANYAFEADNAIGVGMQRVKTQMGWKVERSLDAMNVIRTSLNGSLDLQLLIEDSGGDSAG